MNREQESDASSCLADRAIKHFANRFGRRPEWIAAAPGRVNLIGEHIDYNDGFVFPMAIDRHTIVAAAPNGSRRIELHSLEARDTAEINLDEPVAPAEPAWANYCRGVIAGFVQRGAQIPGCDLLIVSDIPMGSGLSSSAALEVATATALEAATGIALEPVEKALLCQKAEHDFAGVPCGVMDQFASILGRQDHLLLLDCRSRAVEWVPLADESVSVLIADTTVRHKLAAGEYARRRSECETAARLLGVSSLRNCRLPALKSGARRLPPVIFRRARHVVTEIERTLETAAAFRAGDWTQAGRLMYASHASLRADFEVSCPELDLLVCLAQRIGLEGGVYGSRMTGGGFGGCTVSLVATAGVRDVVNRISRACEAQIGTAPLFYLSRPSAGAHLIHSPPR
jgi:galactokinase